jgi:hypothetical protein
MSRYNKTIFDILLKKIGSKWGVYSAIRRKELIFKAVKPEILFYLVAIDHGIKISKHEKDENILAKVDELSQRGSSIQVRQVEDKVKNESMKQSEVDPFLIPLSKYNLFSDLSKECKIRKPYSKEINYAILNLEDFMRKKMGLDDSFYGIKLVDEAKKLGVFKRRVAGESEGLNFLYRSAILWLRNGGAHKKRGSEKEECFKIILFTDYLIKLFDDLYEQNVKS